MHMKKLFHKSDSSSRSRSQSPADANPYAEGPSSEGPKYSPYAIGSSQYSSVPTYSPTTVSSYDTHQRGRSLPENPYEPGRASQERPRSDSPAYSPEPSDYGRTLLLQKRSKPTISESHKDYDPSIMETEQEREARHALQHGQQDYQSLALQDERQADEDGEVAALKDQIRFTNKQSLNSADSAIRYAEEAEASGLRTLQMLGEQSDQIASAEGSIAVTDNQTKLAEDYAGELRKLNRSMFAIHASNPFSSRSRLIEQEQKIRDSFRNQQLDREATRQRQYNSQQLIASAMGNTHGERRRLMTETEIKYREQMKLNKQEIAESSKFLFEPEEEDFVDEREINRKLDVLGTAASRLNMMAKSINTEVTSQNDRIARLDSQTQEVELGVHLNTARLARIH